MKYSHLIYILFFIFFLLEGCSHSSSLSNSPSSKHPINDWLIDDPQACVDYYISIYDSIIKGKHYDSLAHSYEEILKEMPVDPIGNKDALRKSVFRLLFLHHQVMRKTKQYEPAIHLLDSIRLSGQSFLSTYCLYPLLAMESQNSLMTDDNKRTEQLANTFRGLSEPNDASLIAECCHIVSWTYHFCSAEPRADSKMQERAVLALKRSATIDYAGDILARMGYFYRREGRYEQSVDILLQAVNWYEQHPEASIVGKIRAYGDLAALYSTLELDDKALQANAYSIQLSLKSDSNQLADMLRIRSALYAENMQSDSAFAYLEKELSVIGKNDKEHLKQYLRDRAKYLLSFRTDSDAVALRDISALYNDSAGVRPAVHSCNRYWMGKALERNGQKLTGLQLMEQAYREFVDMEWEEMIDFTARELLDKYATEHMDSKLASLYPRYIVLRDSLSNKSKLLYTAAANVRYETTRKEQENRMLTAEVNLKQHTLTYTWVVAALLFMLLGLAIIYILQHRKYYRRENQLHRERISHLITIHQELNQRYEQMNDELEKGVHVDVIENVRQKLNPILLSGEDEMRFRQSFAALYPHYLPVLRRQFPELTKNDELLCMLIILNQSTDEIALVLGISRASVNSGRSRIRKKFGLEKDDSLEDYLLKIKK